MINVIIQDIINSVSNAFNGADSILLILFALSAVWVGTRCNSLSHLFAHALEALLITALLYTVYNIVVPNMPDSTSIWSKILAGEWNELMGFTLQRVLGYYFLMLTAIAAVFALKNILTRR